MAGHTDMRKGFDGLAALAQIALIECAASRRADAVRSVIAATKAREVQRGDTVAFDDRDGRNTTGLIVRINQRTATIGTSTAEGGTWRVPFHMLRHVLDT